jgi:Kef-type K+ transport system membrane component KefB
MLSRSLDVTSECVVVVVPIVTSTTVTLRTASELDRVDGDIGDVVVTSVESNPVKTQDRTFE